MSLAYLKNNVVRYIAPDNYAPPPSWDYDLPARNGIGANVGDTWNGAAYVRPPERVEQITASTIDTQLLAAMADIDTYAALSAPTAVQRLNYERLIGKCVKQLIRLRLNRLEAAT